MLAPASLAFAAEHDIVRHSEMLSAYLDETGLDAETDLLWIAGYVADSTTWFDFSREWREGLREHRVTALHMREFTASRGQFVGWSEPQRKALLTDAISIINAKDVHGIAVGVDKAAFDEAVHSKEGRVNVTLTGEPARDPYLWAFHDVVIELANQVDHLQPGERVACVLDRQERLEAASRRIFVGLAGDTTWPRHARLGSLSFAAADGCPPLQAADLLAYEVRKERNRRRSTNTRSPRISLSRLGRRLLVARYWDRDSFIRLAADSRT
jgi:hypothetical protein